MPKLVDEAVTLRTGQSWERNWIIAAQDQAKSNGTEFVRLGSFDGLDAHGYPLPESDQERARRLAIAPRKLRFTRVDRKAIARRMKAMEAAK